MKIKGLDYNTQREHLVLPEYGREVQQMVDYCVGLKSRAERQRCANTIIAVMERMMPHNYENKDYRQKLWDHLALMSGFQLDIDYPCDITEAHNMLKKPAPMRYPMKRIPVRHYGNMMFEVFELLKNMPNGVERTARYSSTSTRSSSTAQRLRHAIRREDNVVENKLQSLWNRL